ncbi:MAG TPA: glycosyltransferase family 39 protein [Candidatus Acidoferrum sp.]|nr:glycosyltransferase family 39 protein [Candidatus Acidoferrum sp.]
MKIPGRFFFTFAAVLLLALMTLLAGGAARRESVTFDEIAHIGAGVSYLQKLDLRMNEEHPPLAKVVAALPLVVRGVQADYAHISWTFSSKIFRQFLGEWVFGHWFLMRWNDPYSTLLWARAPMLLLTLSLGLTLYIYGSRLGSPWGGLLCLSAFVTMPAFIAFGPLVITDIAVTLFWVLTVWQLPNMWRSPTQGTVVRFGLILAGALLSKFSSGLLFFVFVAFALSLRFKPLPEQPVEKTELRRWRRRAWRNIGIGTLWAALFVYIVCLVLSWNQPTDSFQVIPHFPASPVLRRLLMPVWIYLRGLAEFAMSASSRPTFILGHAYSHGVWFYFPVLFLLKSQLAFLLLLLLASAAALLVKRRSPSQAAIPAGMEMKWRSVWVSLVIFVAACMLNRLDISIRHFSVALALVVLLLAPFPRMLKLLRDSNPQAARIGIWAAVALVLVSIVTAIRAYPNYFPYLNMLSMERPGYTLVNDSNLDWNQALPQVELFVRQRGLQQVLLDEYGFVEPAAYVPQAQLWDCQQPAPHDGGQWVVVSANYMLESGNCIWLLRYQHQALAGGSMYAVQLPEVIPAAGQPGGPPLPADYRFVGGMAAESGGLSTFWICVRDPQQLQPTWDRMMAMAEKYRKKKK